MSNEFVVRSADTRVHGMGDHSSAIFECELESWHGHKVSFRLMIEGCVGEKEYQAQCAVIAPYMQVGRLLACDIVYRRLDHCFSMALYGFTPIEAMRLDSGSVIDADTYLNPNRGFWTRTVIDGPRVLLPGIIDLGGDAYIPVVETDPLPHVAHSYHYQAGLQYGARPSGFRQFLRWARWEFGWKPAAPPAV